MAADEELHILHSKGCGIGFGRGLFAGPQEEEEGKGNHVRVRSVGLTGHHAIAERDRLDVA